MDDVKKCDSTKKVCFNADRLESGNQQGLSVQTLSLCPAFYPPRYGAGPLWNEGLDFFMISLLQGTSRTRAKAQIVWARGMDKNTCMFILCMYIHLYVIISLISFRLA